MIMKIITIKILWIMIIRCSTWQPAQPHHWQAHPWSENHSQWHWNYLISKFILIIRSVCFVFLVRIAFIAQVILGTTIYSILVIGNLFRVVCDGFKIPFVLLSNLNWDLISSRWLLIWLLISSLPVPLSHDRISWYPGMPMPTSIHIFIITIIIVMISLYADA